MNIIVCADERGAIGYKNDLLYNIKEDKKLFKSLTINKTIVMGRKTFESLPDQKPLPQRRNVVMTRNKSYRRDGIDTVCSVDDLNNYIKKNNISDDDIFIIGGSDMYRIFLPQCKKIYLTLVHTENYPPADTFFPDFAELFGNGKYTDKVFLTNIFI